MGAPVRRSTTWPLTVDGAGFRGPSAGGTSAGLGLRSPPGGCVNLSIVPVEPEPASDDDSPSPGAASDPRVSPPSARSRRRPVERAPALPGADFRAPEGSSAAGTVSSSSGSEAASQAQTPMPATQRSANA